jgi:predicted metal-dependent enzyme (double-stranded beta helix superfamily)
MFVVPAARPAAPATRLLRRHARRADLLDGLDLAGTERTWERVATDEDGELWLIVWPVGTATGWHDHGSASGAFTVLRGALTEYAWDGSVHSRTLRPGEARTFSGSHVHDVVNDGGETAVSLHVYAPRLAAMTRYDLVRGRLVATGVEHRGDLW